MVAHYGAGKQKMFSSSSKCFSEMTSHIFCIFFISTLSITPGVNFINVKRTNFSYEHCFGSFFLVTYT